MKLINILINLYDRLKIFLETSFQESDPGCRFLSYISQLILSRDILRQTTLIVLSLTIESINSRTDKMSRNYMGITIEELKSRIEDMSESDEDVWDSEDDIAAQTDKKSDSEDEKEHDFFFEGAEKLLEIWFTTRNQNGQESDLRNIPR